MSRLSSYFILFLFLAIACRDTSVEIPTLPSDINDVQLAPPPVGQGVQIGIAPFEVPRGSEVQRNYYLTLPTEDDIYINLLQFRYNEGSHHCNVFKSDSIRKPDGTFEETFTTLDFDNWDMFAASQSDSLDWQLPPGVAIKLVGRQQICIQTHYVNAATQQTPSSRGKVLLNLWTIPQSSVTSLVGLLFASNTRIIIPPHDSATTQKFIVPIPWNIHILTMTGHFHSRGKVFWAKRLTTDEEIYRSQAWNEPPVKIFEGDGYFLPRSERIVYFSTFYNPTSDTIFMGPHVENQEHSNLFMTFYPGPADGKTIYDVDEGW